MLTCGIYNCSNPPPPNIALASGCFVCSVLVAAAAAVAAGQYEYINVSLSRSAIGNPASER